MLETKLAELLISRLCHDLTSPIGAVNNGVELVVEMGAEMGGDAGALIGSSAAQAAAELALFRLAFGGAGSAALEPERLGEIAHAYVAAQKQSLHWQIGALGRAWAGRSDGPRLVLNALLLVSDGLPQGGTLAVSEAAGLTISGEGRSLGWTDRTETLVAGQADLDSLDARHVQPYYFGLVARRLGGGVALAQTPESISVTIT